MFRFCILMPLFKYAIASLQLEDKTALQLDDYMVDVQIMRVQCCCSKYTFAIVQPSHILTVC